MSDINTKITELDISNCNEATTILATLDSHESDDEVSKGVVKDKDSNQDSTPPILANSDTPDVDVTVGSERDVAEEIKHEEQEEERANNIRSRSGEPVTPIALDTKKLSDSESDSDSSDEEQDWCERIEKAARMAMQPAENDEDDLTAGLVGDVNRSLMLKLQAGGLEHMLAGPSLDESSGEEAPCKVLPASFIRKFSSLYSWEIARILHAFDKLADNFVELLQSQTSSDASRKEDLQFHLEQRALRAAGSSGGSGGSAGADRVENLALFSKEEEEEDDLMDSLVEDKNTLVQENIGSKNRYRFRNSVADTLFNLERSHSQEGSEQGSPERDSDEDGRRRSMSPNHKSSNNGIGVYEVLLHSRQLGMTIENVMERTVVRAVHPNSEAARLHVKRDSAILKIGSNSTLAQTHLETLDALKNTVRPVKLRLCTIDLSVLQLHRARMQSLVQRRKNLAIGACTTLNWIETRVLWVLELTAFTEALSAVHSPPQVVPRDGVNSSETVEQRLEEEAARAKKHEVRALKLLEKYKKAKYAFFENGRREALVNTRLQVLSEIMQDVYLLLDWQLAKDQADATLSLSEGRSSVGLIAQSLRDICYTLLQLTNDQQVDLQLIFPDHHTCLVIDRLVQISLNPYMIKTHHIPSLWRLAGGNAPSARIACANLIPLLYLHLTPLQRLRTRGLLNRLLVDTIPAVRAYVLNSVCVRLLHSVVAKLPPTAKDKSPQPVEPQTVTLNWMSHVLVQGSLDTHVDVRQSALLACNQMIEYHSLGLLENSANESQALASRLRDLLGNVGNPPVSSAPVFHTMERPKPKEGEEEGSTVKATSPATMEYFNINKELQLTDEFRAGDGRGAGGNTQNNGEKSLNFDPEKVVVPALAEAHIMFCRMLPIVSRLVEDDRPEMRAAVVSMCGDFCIWMGGKWSAILLDVMLCCFRDGEDIVRAAAVTAVPHAVLALVKTAVAAEGAHNYESIAKLFVSLIPAVCTMHSDQSKAVRKALCRTLSQVLALLYAVSRKESMSKFLFLPKMQAQVCDVMIMLLEDKALEVSCEMLNELSACLDKEMLQSDKSWYTSLLFTRKNSQQLTRSIAYLSKPPSHWRVRRLVCILIPRLVATTTSVEGRTSISLIIIPLLYDTVFEVRKAAARAFCMSAVCDYRPPSQDSEDSDVGQIGSEKKADSKKKMSPGLLKSSSSSSLSLTPDGEPLQDMGQMWLDCFVLPQLESLRTSRVYHQRVLALHMIVLLIKEQVVRLPDVRFNILINIALTLADDRIPNVRMALCQLVDVLREHVIDHSRRYQRELKGEEEESLDQGSDFTAMVLRAMRQLLTDADRDVQHAAVQLRDHLNADYVEYKAEMERTSVGGD